MWIELDEEKILSWLPRNVKIPKAAILLLVQAEAELQSHGPVKYSIVQCVNFALKEIQLASSETSVLGMKIRAWMASVLSQSKYDCFRNDAVKWYWSAARDALHLWKKSGDTAPADQVAMSDIDCSANVLLLKAGQWFWIAVQTAECIQGVIKGGDERLTDEAYHYALISLIEFFDLTKNYFPLTFSARPMSNLIFGTGHPKTRWMHAKLCAFFTFNKLLHKLDIPNYSLKGWDEEQILEAFNNLQIYTDELQTASLSEDSDECTPYTRDAAGHLSPELQVHYNVFENQLLFWLLKIAAKPALPMEDCIAHLQLLELKYDRQVKLCPYWSTSEQRTNLLEWLHAQR